MRVVRIGTGFQNRFLTLEMISLGRKVKKGRCSLGGILLAAMLIISLLMTLGAAYLSLAERDNRFAGVEERQEQAWFLALAGQEYYQVRCGSFENLPLLANDKANLVAATPQGDGSILLARVCLTPEIPNHYFELWQYPDKTLLSRGVVEGSLSGLSNRQLSAERRLFIVQKGVNRLYDSSILP